MVLDAALFNTQHYKVRIKGRSYRKGSLWVDSYSWTHQFWLISKDLIMMMRFIYSADHRTAQLHNRFRQVTIFYLFNFVIRSPSGTCAVSWEQAAKIREECYSLHNEGSIHSLKDRMERIKQGKVLMLKQVVFRCFLRPIQRIAITFLAARRDCITLHISLAFGAFSRKSSSRKWKRKEVSLTLEYFHQ